MSITNEIPDIQKPVIICGHSHVFVFGFDSTSKDSEHCLHPLHTHHGGIFGFSTIEGPYNERYWHKLCELQQFQTGARVIIFWLGSQHLAEFLFEHATKFDFFLKNRNDIAVDLDSMILPYALVRSHQFKHFVQLQKIIDLLQSMPGFSVYLAATPPPKGDNVKLRGLMEQEPYFKDLASRLGLELEKTQMTPPSLRLKLYLLMQEIVQEIAFRKRISYISVPKELVDPSGYLREEFWEKDVGHANTAYGEVFLSKGIIHALSAH